MKSPKVCIVADWLTVMGGAEAVLQSLCELYPQAPIFTTLYEPSRLPTVFRDREVKTAPYLNRLPSRFRRRHPMFLSVLPWAIEQLDVRDYDIVISSSSFVGKGVLTHPDQLHICYCHAPSRYLWEQRFEYVQHFPLPKFFKRLLPGVLHKLRTWDYLAAQRPDVMIANSNYIADSIGNTYRRQAQVLSPPIDVGRFAVGGVSQYAPTDVMGEYYLAFGRLVPQKRFDLLVEAFRTMPDKQLVIAGDGRNRDQLRAQAADLPNIKFLGRVDDVMVPSLLSQAQALLYPQIEDAGITPLESLACGTPVIALGKGGVLSVLEEGQHALFFAEQTPEAITQAVQTFEKQAPDFDPKILQKHAQAFDTSVFQNKFQTIVDREWERFSRG